MQTHCSCDQLEFEGFDGHKVVAGFDGGAITSDAGALLLRHVDKAVGLFRRVAAGFIDRRDPDCTVHSVQTLVGQRIAAIALGYEDVDDHDTLRHDPVLALLSESLTPKREDCAVLAGKSTLNRLEHGRVGEPTRYHKIGHDTQAIEALFVDLFLEAHEKSPGEIVLDLDATDDPLHGHQEGRFFHGYYNCYCYLPLYVFCGRHLLAAKLRRSNIDASKGSVDEVERIVRQIRRKWRRVRIILRADSGFARDELMSWCEANRVDYVFGIARNERLEKRIAPALQEACRVSRKSGQAARVFRDFLWSTKDSWSRRRRVIAKAEWTTQGANPRFIVTSLKAKRWAARALYEDLYCARGDMENRIKECQLDLYADRTSAHTMRANQLRLWFASFAYVLICALRRLGLAHTRLAEATCGTIRLKLLKIGAQVRVSVRRIKVAMASACPYADEFALAHARIRAAAR
ncbi:IS1380 family transposase [Allomesorhizobium camelthorni]|uniref:IS1380 family transposase n=1 Tax=Allomesorhizobium camelthorni TaxID=475069 RepID=A0A6G4WP90_9HYPH|nr:IS1380 family transposase [Mesorhizobium camelthorni]NGO56198.1 IS1380 family transposase [Mesorhizobium camelthorni]